MLLNKASLARSAFLFTYVFAHCPFLYFEGVTPIIALKLRLKAHWDSKPTARYISVIFEFPELRRRQAFFILYSFSTVRKPALKFLRIRWERYRG